MSNLPRPWGYRIFLTAAIVGMGGWFVIFAVWLWWMLQPVVLPTITEPIEVLNPGKQVSIGEPLVLELDISKPKDVNPSSNSRILECESGNLVTLTASSVPLPVGVYSVVNDSIIVPAKVTPGDRCVATFIVVYDVNPIRKETARWSSEPFTVLAPKDD